MTFLSFSYGNVLQLPSCGLNGACLFDLKLSSIQSLTPAVNNLLHFPFSHMSPVYSSLLLPRMPLHARRTKNRTSITITLFILRVMPNNLLILYIQLRCNICAMEMNDSGFLRSGLFYLNIFFKHFYAFSRCFYPKRLTNSSYTYFVCVFPGNWTHNLLLC